MIKIIMTKEVLGKQLNVYGSFDKPLFLAKDVADWIEHSNPRVMLKLVDDCDRELCSCCTNGGIQRMSFLNERGLMTILANSRKQIACDIKKEIQDIIKYSSVPKELMFGSMLIDALNELDVKIVSQLNVEGYRIDFYIPQYNIAVEYDEEQHYTDANIKLDKEREDYVKSKLGCEFIRCDYRDKDIVNVMKVVKRLKI